MESVLAGITDRGAAAESVATEEATATEPAGTRATLTADAEESRSQYLADLYGVINEIETLFPEVVRVLRERVADLERFLTQSENPFIQNGAIVATHEVVQAVHLVIQRIAGKPRLS